MTSPALRVLHVAQPVDGGVARVVADLAADQVRRGWDVSLACPPGGTLAADAVAGGVTHVPWFAQRASRAGTPRQVRALAALVAQVDPDVVHLHSASAGLTGRLAVLRRRPTLFQPHGWSWQAVDGLFARATTGWERVGQHLVDDIICVSEAERDNGRARGLRRTCVVPNGVDTKRFVPSAAGPARRELGLDDVPTAVCVGRLDAQKGQEVLVRAWPGVRARVPDAVLVLVGDGPRREALVELADRLGIADAVLLPGVRSDVPRWYTAADVVAFSSLHGEAMALTPLEAQASGRPLVASDVSGVRESLGRGAGTVVPPGDASAFATAVADRLADPDRAAAEGAAGRRHAEAELDVARSFDRLAAVTLAAADRRRRV
jgi:glycosyltransferase involved in cell wall biosynthesis